MRYLIAALALVVGIGSLTVHMAIATHLTVVVLCWLPIWWADITLRPLAPCKHCDKGRTWDNAHEHFGEYCSGGRLGIGSCSGVGKKLRWEVKLLRVFGGARDIPDPVANARAN